MRRLVLIVLLAVLFALTLLPATVLAAPTDLTPYTPYDLTATLLDSSAYAYGSALLTFKVDNLPRDTSTDRWHVKIEKKIGDGEWIEVSLVATSVYLDAYSTGPYQFEQLWTEDYAWEGDTVVSWRVSVSLYDETWWGVGDSPWSNVASVGVQGSSWAVPELLDAQEYGLIPDILAGKDLTQPITREEFCELALVLYEKTTGTTVPTPTITNPFTDTQNVQILKAFVLGITKGTSDTTFSPNKLISREECATMLFRAIKAIAPSADYSIAGVPDFPDQQDIASWAVEGAKYMFKLGIIKGDAQGYFMPKATTTAQEAAGYGRATREAAILMAVRTYEQLN